MLKEEIKDAYYHLRLRPADGMRLAFLAGSRIYVPLYLNRALGVAPWLFTKAMTPIVGFLRRLGHRSFAYLNDLFGAAKPPRLGNATGVEETWDLGRAMGLMLDKIGLTLHPDKRFFGREPTLEILGIFVDTEKQQLPLSPKKLTVIEKRAARLLRYASQHRRFILRKEVERFFGLANASTPAVVD